jgi:hypothetical protein
MLGWIVDILRVGLSGFVFLLCAMAYRLLRAEQCRAHPSSSMLATINRYMWQSIICALLVGGFSFADAKAKHDREESRDALVACADSLGRLDSFTKLPGTSEDNLRLIVSKHVAACESLKDVSHAR